MHIVYKLLYGLDINVMDCLVFIGRMLHHPHIFRIDAKYVIFNTTPEIYVEHEVIIEIVRLILFGN